MWRERKTEVRDGVRETDGGTETGRQTEIQTEIQKQTNRNRELGSETGEGRRQRESEGLRLKNNWRRRRGAGMDNDSETLGDREGYRRRDKSRKTER